MSDSNKILNSYITRIHNFKILQNTTYGEVRPVERVIIPNETYGFPENQVTKFEASDTDESVVGETLTESKNQDNIEVRPSSAYREINRNSKKLITD